MVCVTITIYAQNGSDQNIDFQIVAQDNIGTPIYRAPVVIPIRGQYIALSETLYLSFSYDIGVINVQVENLFTDEYTSDDIPTNSGVYAITIMSNTGQYKITITTQGGQQYFAEFQI